MRSIVFPVLNLLAPHLDTPVSTRDRTEEVALATPLAGAGADLSMEAREASPFEESPFPGLPHLPDLVKETISGYLSPEDLVAPHATSQAYQAFNEKLRESQERHLRERAEENRIKFYKALPSKIFPHIEGERSVDAIRKVFATGDLSSITSITTLELSGEGITELSGKGIIELPPEIVFFTNLRFIILNKHRAFSIDFTEFHARGYHYINSRQLKLYQINGKYAQDRFPLGPSHHLYALCELIVFDLEDLFLPKALRSTYAPKM